MGIIDTLMGNDTGLTDKDIAFDMLKDSKFGIVGITLALTESTNNQLRQMLGSQLNNCIAEHHRLADLAIRKDWYLANAAPVQQVENDYRDSQNVIR
jgi:similar to spore coat protein